MDPPLAKAEAISESDNTSGIKYLRRGGGAVTCTTEASAGEKSDNMQEHQPCRHQGQ